MGTYTGDFPKSPGEVYPTNQESRKCKCSPSTGGKTVIDKSDHFECPRCGLPIRGKK